MGQAMAELHNQKRRKFTFNAQDETLSGPETDIHEVLPDNNDVKSKLKDMEYHLIYIPF
jgi:endonuclease I